jgi:hypothetical protein
MDGFTLLKRTYPINTSERDCDAYKHLMENTTSEQRLSWGIVDADLKRTIKENEKYIYQAGKVKGDFQTVSYSFENYALIRKFIYGIADEL